VIEATNGIVHPAFSIAVGGYTPGLITSLALLPLAVALLRQLPRAGTSSTPHVQQDE